MHDLSIIKYMNGTPKYKRMIDRRVRIIKIKEFTRRMVDKISNKITEWLYSKILTYPLWKWMRAHKYSDNKLEK